MNLVGKLELTEISIYLKGWWNYNSLLRANALGYRQLTERRVAAAMIPDVRGYGYNWTNVYGVDKERQDYAFASGEFLWLEL